MTNFGTRKKVYFRAILPLIVWQLIKVSKVEHIEKNHNDAFVDYFW
jgi:hypothetical protein